MLLLFFLLFSQQQNCENEKVYDGQKKKNCPKQGL